MPRMSDLTNLPASITAGTTTAYTKTYDDYPASAWDLKLIIAGAAVVIVDAVADGDAFVVTLTPALSRDLAAGVYRWVERVTEQAPGERVLDVDSGTVNVAADLAQAAPGDAQTWEEKQLPKVERAIEDLTTSGMTSYQIGTRAATMLDLSDLLTLRDRLKAAIARQRNPGRSSTPVLFGFSPTGFDR